jgi:hypothetical protein
VEPRGLPRLKDLRGVFLYIFHYIPIGNFIIFFCVLVLVSIFWLHFANVLILKKKFSLNADFYIFVLLTLLSEGMIFLLQTNECSQNMFIHNTEECVCEFNNNFQWLIILLMTIFLAKISFVTIVIPSLWIYSFWKKELLSNLIPVALSYLFIVFISYIIFSFAFALLAGEYHFLSNMFDIYQCEYPHIMIH